MHTLNLIRYKNLFMIAFIQCLIKYVFFKLPQFTNANLLTALNSTTFTALVFATLCIAAAGYIINDIYDVEADTINKPHKLIVGKHISEDMANNLFMGFTVVGVLLGFYVSWQVDKTSFSALFLIASGGLYAYATSLKSTILIGNIIVSTLVSLSILVIGVFEIIPMITAESRNAYTFLFKFLLDYALFAFLVNLIREIVKDLEDVDGDYKAGYYTLPLAIGRKRTSTIAFVLSLITIASIFYYVLTYVFENTYLLLYFIFFVIGPLLYIAIKLLSAKNKAHFTHLSLVLKITLFLGMLSIVVLKITS